MSTPGKLRQQIRYVTASDGRFRARPDQQPPKANRDGGGDQQLGSDERMIE